MIRLDRPLKDRLREPAPLPAALDATWMRIRSRRGWYERRGFAWLALATAVALLCVFNAKQLRSWRDPAPKRLALADGSPVGLLETAAEARAITLTDGSRITLASNTQLRPHTADHTQFRSELIRGRAVFDVVPHGPRRWIVQAGAVRVSVLGTRFSVELRAGKVEVAVERGLVEVAGPSVAAGRVQLRANQRVQVAASLPSPTVRSAPAPVAPPSAADETAPQPAPEHAAESKPRPRDEAELVRLLARADEARLDGQLRVAAEVFERVVRDYPNDPRAGLAAFTLGRLYLDQLGRPDRAAKAFARACSLGLPSSLAEEGSARLVDALARAGQHARACVAAADYTARFPNGLHRGDVETWTSCP